MTSKLFNQEFLDSILKHRHSSFGSLKEITPEVFDVFALGHPACPGTMFAPGVGYCPGGYTSGALNDCTSYGGSVSTSTYCIS